MSKITTEAYLDQKTKDLESQMPVPPSQAQVAQIPLQSFSLPTFPPEAQNLTTLTLTSDIKLDEYTTLLTPSSTSTSTPPLPTLPPTIQNLTLELFSLGYPPPFLTQLSTRLPNLKTLVIYSQLFAGTTEESLKDAVQFFRNEKGIVALHLLDVFVPSTRGKQFFEGIGEGLRGSLRFLEVNYTFRHSDPEFLKGLPAKELPFLIGKELVSCVFGMSAPEVVVGDEDDREGEEEGILAVEEAGELVAALSGADRPRGLLALDVTLYKLRLEQLKEVLECQKVLKILAVTLELAEGDGVEGIVDVLGLCGGLEEIEIVGFPKDESFVESVKAGKDVGPTEGNLESLGVSCPELRKIKMSILRTREMVWEKVEGKWKRL